jgi:hypothetical protein
VGAYLFASLDIDVELKGHMVKVMRMLEMLMRKSSTPGDRAFIRRELPVVFTCLELAMPVYIQSMVVHYLVYHAVDHLEETGPFHVSNMLDMERFQTVLKSCAKGKKNVMQSIVSNYQLLKTSLQMRLVSPFDWVVSPCQSSTAAYLDEADSMKRNDRMHRVQGASRYRLLRTHEFKNVVHLWSQQNEEYRELTARFQEDQKEHQRHSRRHLLVDNIADWKPRRKLSNTEKKWISMQPTVKVIHVVHIILIEGYIHPNLGYICSNLGCYHLKYY